MREGVNAICYVIGHERFLDQPERRIFVHSRKQLLTARKIVGTANVWRQPVRHFDAARHFHRGG
jgi:hypothetical protein